MNIAQLLMTIVFPDIESAHYEHSDVESIMLYALKHYHSFMDIDKSFRKTLKSLAFLRKGDMLLTPDRFYDPDHTLLQKLFLCEENFPSSAYSEQAIVMVLREVGLRGVEDVEAEDLHEAALTIQVIVFLRDIKRSLTAYEFIYSFDYKSSFSTAKLLVLQNEK